MDLSEDIVEKIDAAVSTLLFDNGAGLLLAPVCFCCDLLLPYACNRKLMKIQTIIDKRKLFKRPESLSNIELISDYSYTGSGNRKIKKLMISKRSCYNTKSDSLLVCNSCETTLKKKAYPKFGICNGWFIGNAPSVLEELTEVELAFISPVRVQGHIITYYGGEKGIKGWHSLMKCDMKSTVRTLQGMETLELPNRIVVVLSGPMTADQKRRVSSKMTVRRDKCWLAIQHQIANNSLTAKEFEGFDMSHIPDPILIDKSKDWEGPQLDSNIEMTEEYTVCFPDSTLDSTYGGYATIKDFKEIVNEVNRGSSNHFCLHSKTRGYLNDYCDENILKAFPKLFPYGRGGPNEIRLDGSGDVWKIPVDEYIQHINSLSNPNFHGQMFNVVSYNILMRQEMLKKSCFKMKSTGILGSKFAGLTADEVTDYVTKKNAGNRGSSCLAAASFIDLVDVITGSLPHSNRAAATARSDSIAMQVQLGSPAAFFSITPDDSNSSIILEYCRFKPEQNVNETVLTTASINSRTKERKLIQISYPGMCSIWFEVVLDIIIRHVIGWDRKKGCAIEGAGCFGIPEALIGAIEEQGRKTLHCHFIVFVKGYNLLLNHLQSGDEKVRKLAEKDLLKLHNDSVSTALVVNPRKDMFQHGQQCIDPTPMPTVISQQRLRELRHQEGCRSHLGKMVMCGSCGESWSSEMIVLQYLKSLCKDSPDLIQRLKLIEETDPIDFSLLAELLTDQVSPVKSTIHGMKLNQNQTGPEIEKRKILRQAVANAVHNLHSSLHVKPCFKGNLECRFNHPRCPAAVTSLRVDKEFDTWFSWNGLQTVYKQYEIELQRNEFDVMVNQHVPFISKSCIATNSNISFMTDARGALYMTNYQTKGNQEEEETEFGKVLQFSQRRMYESRYSTEFSEGLSRLLGASFVHSSSNVISPWLAKYLIRNRSRFIMSHVFVLLPLEDLLLEVSGSEGKHRVLKQYKTEEFIDSKAQHYMYRPKELENITCQEFYLKYNVIRQSDANKKDLIFFTDESYQGTKFMGVIASKEKNRVIRFSLKHIEDSAKFGTDLMTSQNESITNDMEVYAKAILIIFSSWRTLSDLLVNDSYVVRFQRWWKKLHSKEKASIQQQLSNIQNIKNSSRLPRVKDRIQRETEVFVGSCTGKTKENTAEVSEMSDDVIATIVAQYSPPPDPVSPNETRTALQSLNLTNIIDAGKFLCGSRNIADVIVNHSETGFVSVANHAANTNNTTTNALNFESRTVTIKMLDELILSRVERIVLVRQEQGDSTEPRQTIDIIANGTAHSIRKWGKHMSCSEDGLDREQQQTFEIMAAKFVLSYYDDAEGNTSNAERGQLRGRGFGPERKNLLRMIPSSCHKQLIMFATGPAGAGKSDVIKVLLAYCQNFCSQLDVPFSKDTIKVTAMSGVAATLINGETVHSAVHLCRKLENITEEHIEAFEGVRMLIIDEISMAASEEIRKMNLCLRRIKQSLNSKYGGLDIVFFGDFSQIPSVQSPHLYEDPNLFEWHQWINCFIELKGRWRFKDDPEWGDICWRFHQGIPTKDDFEVINGRVISETNKLVLPTGIRYAVHFNRDRDAINTGTFLKYLDKQGGDQALLVLAGNVKIKSAASGYQDLHSPTAFWSQCGESHSNTSDRTRIDPVLKLYPNCPVMFVQNLDVQGGLAKGSQGIVDNIVLKPGTETKQILFHGHQVRAVEAQDVSHIVVKLRGSNSLLRPKNIQPKEVTFRCHYPLPNEFQNGGKMNREWLQMKSFQFPFVSNTATTGHKLQGSTVNDLFVPFWHYGTPNWPYVIISRVRTRWGLFLGQKLNPDYDYSLDHRIVRMLNHFRRLTPEIVEP